ncbi:MAG TPA: hypothetical protein VG796_27075 [Verrucomicrobiales bacterium]|jgi:hypothetical protein|nr:hypothetical protein [Verrucomicrobiales bacterium]
MNPTTFFQAIPPDPAANEAAISLGGWLFVPAPGLVVEPKRIQHHSPVRSSGNSAPVVGELYRTGGEAMYYSVSRRRILTVQQYRKLLLQHPKTVKEDWRIVQRNTAAYGRGTVHHPDHRPITLHGWHRILIDAGSEAAVLPG